MARSIFILVGLVFLWHAAPVRAAVSAEALYADCTASHMPESSRNAADWVKVRRCENVVVGTVRALPWPGQTPAQVKWPNGAITNDFLICPTDPAAYDAEKLIDFYLRYWDQKGLGYFSGKTQTAQEAVVEAFTAQFADCAKGRK